MMSNIKSVEWHQQIGKQRPDGSIVFDITSKSTDFVYAAVDPESFPKTYKGEDVSKLQITHNGQPVNLDAILDLAADVGAGPQPFDKAVDWEGTLINYMARLHNKHHALSPTDQAFLAERLEGG